MENRFEVTVGAGTMMSASGAAIRFPHRWTSSGVTVEADFTGAHLLHLAAAGCVLVEVSSDASADQLAQLLDVVDQVAEIPRAIRAGAPVQRGS
jgi:hypothetical protein